MKRIYLDYAATTPVDPAVQKAMEPYFGEKFGNPSSIHSFGQEAMAAVDKSREVIAKACGVGFRDVIFTASATEANNLAIRGVLGAVRQFPSGTGRSPTPPGGGVLGPSATRSANGRNQARVASGTFLRKTVEPLRVITTQIEHESILATCRDLENQGVEVVYLPVNREGIVDVAKLKKALDKKTILISIGYANNEIGVIQAIAKIAQIVRNWKLEIGNSESVYPLFHTDAVQAFQYLNSNMS